MTHVTSRSLKRQKGRRWLRPDVFVRPGTIDPATGRPLSRFKRRRLERDPRFRETFEEAQKTQRQLAEAAAVTKDAKQRLRDAAEGR